MLRLMEVFILDVDGVMTTGQFFYDTGGKCYKVFGADDNDALKVLQKSIPVRFVSGDKRGFEISRKRIVDDMGFELDLVSTSKRIEWIKERYKPESVIYMGDGIFDHYVFQEVGYSIAPANANESIKVYARYVTKRSGGDRAVAEAAEHIAQKFGFNWI